MSALSDFSADRNRYSRSAWISERALWAVAVYRIGRATIEATGPKKYALLAVYAVLSPLVKVLTQVEIPRSAEVGPGLRIAHGGPVVIHSESRVGKNCSLNVGCILGQRGDGTGAPTIGDRVTFGAFAMVIGAVRVGDDVFIGAMTLVRTDVPSGATAVGVPARVLDRVE